MLFISIFIAASIAEYRVKRWHRNLSILQMRLAYCSWYRFFFQGIYLFGVLSRLQHCTGHITKGSWKGRGNQYIQLVKVLYCKLPTNGKQLPAFPPEAVPGTKPRPQRWEVRMLALCHRGPLLEVWDMKPTYWKSWTGILLM